MLLSQPKETLTMPIRPELRHFYRGPAWRATRERILARAGNCCEQCRKPNGEKVETCTGKTLTGDAVMFWRALSGPWIFHDGRRATNNPVFMVSLRVSAPRTIRVVLTIAHLNHVAGDDRDENLRALCQWCHLHYDAPHHHETRAERKDRARPLLRGAA